MAFLLPDNIPSRSGVPSRLRQVAGALKEWTPDEMMVWLRQTAGGDHYLVVLDPSSGILVIDAPRLPRARRQQPRGRVFDSFAMVGIPQELAKQASDLRSHADETRIASLPVELALAFPDLDEVPSDRLDGADLNLPILTRSDLSGEQLTAALRRILGGGRPRPMNAREQGRARAVVNPEIILARSRASDLPLFQNPEIPLEDVIRVMDREQERVAEHLGPGYRMLRGVAGSGKTLVLAHRARHLHKHWPSWRILVLCYNRVLANALKAMVGADDRLQAINIDRLAWSLAERRRAAGPSDRASSGNAGRASRRGDDSEFERRIARAAEVARRLPDSQRYDAVLVDEAQDFDHPRLDLAYAMLKSERLKPDPAQPDRDNFVVAFDVAQNVYRRDGARWNPPGVDAQGRSRTARGRSTIFRQNYRNTREILGFAMNFLAGSRDWKSLAADPDDPAAVIPPEAAKRTGPEPRLTACRDLAGEAESIAARVAKIVDEGVAVSDIVVMYGHADLEGELRRAFSHRGLPYFHVQERDSRRRQTNRDKAVRVRDRVRASTLTGIKGLEFSRVLIGGVNQLRVHDVDESDQFQAAKSQLYAAMTRAMDELEITMSGDGEIGRALQQAERLQRVG